MGWNGLGWRGLRGLGWIGLGCSRRFYRYTVPAFRPVHHLVPGGAGEPQRPPRGQPPLPRGPALHGPPPLGDGHAPRVARRTGHRVARGPGPEHLFRRGGVAARGRLPAASVVAEGAGEGAGVGGDHRGAAVGADRDLGRGDGLEGVDLRPGDGALGPRDRDLCARRGPVDPRQGGDP